MRPVNNIDPITLDVLDTTTTFKLVKRNGSVCQYNAVSLADFFDATGSWVDPYSNEKLNFIEIGRLERFLRDNQFSDDRQLRQKYLDPDFKQDERFLQQALNDLDDMCCSLVVNTLQLVDEECMSATDFLKESEVIFFPIFDDYFSQMKRSNIDFALQAVLKYITLVKGDPRHQRKHRNRKWIHTMDFLFSKVLQDVFI